MQSYSSIRSRLLKDEKTNREYQALGPEFAVIELLIRRRLAQGISQAVLAKRVGTKQSAISRFESGEYNPTLGFLQKVAKALQANLTMTIS